MINIDFTAINRAALLSVDRLLEHFLPNGKRQGKEYLALNPNRTDDSLGSFSINCITGIWKDFALPGEKGGNDLISLVARLENCSQGEAAKLISDFLGLSSSLASKATNAYKHNRSHKSAKQGEWRSITPIPQNAPPKPPHPEHSQPSSTWEYRNEYSQPLFYVCRFDKGAGREIRPLSYCVNRKTGKLDWRWQGLPPPRPLYNLDKLIANPTAPVLVVEGEKCAEAAAQLFPDHIATTSPAGSSSAKYADWSVLKGRKILIWPDNDAAGRSYCAEVRKLCIEVGATVSIINITKFAHKPGGK